MDLIDFLVDGEYIPHRIIRMPPDGSCLFHCIAHSLYNYIDFDRTSKIRASIVKHIVKNWSEYSAWTCNEHGNCYNSVHEYQYEMLKSTTYGSSCELKAAGVLYALRFEVYFNGKLQGSFGTETNPVKRFLFTGTFLSGHYDVCVPVEIDKDRRIEAIKKGRPNKNKGGRPKTSDKSREEQLREAAHRYRQKHHEERKISVSLYTAKHLEIHRDAVARYSRKHPEINREAVARYTKKHPEINREAAARYTKEHPEINREAAARYTKEHPEIHREAVSRYTEQHPEIHREAVSRYTEQHPEVNKMSKKRYIENKNMKYSGNIEEIVRKVTENIKDRLEAEKIIKWVLQYRKNLIGNYLKTHEHLHANIVSGVEKLRCLPFDCTTLDKLHALAEESLHISTQEPFLYETSYKLLNDDNPIVIDKEGRAIFNDCRENMECRRTHDSKNETWCCNINKCLLDETILQNLEKTFNSLLICTPYNFYRSILDKDEIHVSNIIFLNSVKPHFPKIRTIVRQLYRMKSNCNKVNEIDKALDIVDVENLKELGNPKNIKINNKQLLNVDCKMVEMNLDEDDIMNKYRIAFNRVKQRSLDTPKNECISCQRLLCLRDVSSLHRLRKPIESEIWVELQNYIEKNEIKPCPHICHLCLKKLRSNEMPANCVLNGLHVSTVPDVIKKLNDFEKILIQRAKAFQVVSSMIPVGKKNLPNRKMIKKVKGRTFHLPLPIEATLKKLPRPDEPLNRNHELYILVRSNPTKNKIMWQDLVNVNNVYNALKFLKDNNEHYSKIVLPQNSAQLLDGFNQKLQYKAEESVSNTGKDEDNNTALLTQITEDDQKVHEQYTIYPLYEKRKNTPVSALYQMLKVNAAPLDNREKNLDVKCFPDIYVEGKFGQFEFRKIKLTSAEFIKSRLTSSHSQFRLNQQYLFYLLNDANLRQLSSGIFYKLNVAKQKEKLTAEKYLKMLETDELDGDLTAIFGRLRNTEQFWKKPRSDVVCMSRYYGPATWFLTISPSEWSWTDLEEYIKEINGPDMANKSVSELVALDPVAASRFIEIKFKAMLDFLTSPDNPLGKIEHYFWRREYQARGLQHFHLMLWIKDAPILEESTINQVASFITQYVTCAIPDKNTSPILFERVVKYQTHRHNSYCLRKKKTNIGYKTVCRFGFPRPITTEISIRDVTESVAARKTLSPNSRLYNITRTHESVFINDYNPAVLLAWNGNMDIQYVGEKTSILNFYITKYSTKGEKCHTIDTFENINCTKSLSSRLYNMGLRALSNRECGILEASDTLLGLPLYGTDPNTTIRWLDVNIYRNRRVKSRKEINDLNPESTEIFFESWVDNFYPQRPKDLENIHLYDFSRWYDVVSTPPVSLPAQFYQIMPNKFLKKRERPYIINHYIYDVNKFPEKYYFAILLMFKPWRDLIELKAGQNSYTEAFNIVKDTIKDGLNYGNNQNDFMDNIEKAFEMIDAKICEIQENRQCEEEDYANDNPLDFEPLEARNAMEDFRNVQQIVPEEDIKTIIENLNSDQRRIFEIVTKKLTNESEILRLFVSGNGGTGKSYLINAIKIWVDKYLNKNVAITAPTGIAAFNINGLTIHRLLQLPVEHGFTPKYKPLSDQVLKVLRTDLSNVVLLIIDEVSMISNITLMYIHLRLAEIYDSSEKNNGWFGGIHVLLFGDLLQLPPVREESPFANISVSDVHKFLGSLSACNLWKELFIYDELTINMRQKNDCVFADMLNRIRLGIITKEDCASLLTRLITFDSESNEKRLEELVVYLTKLSDNAVCLLPTNYMCTQLNEAMLSSLAQPEIQLIAIDEIDCPRHCNKKARQALEKYEEDSAMTAGLEKKITIKTGARVMLRRNIDVSIGLVNGSIGTVQQIQYENNDKNTPKKIRIKFNHGLVYDLERVKTKFEILSRVYVYREQFPICLSYAITIHKSQGLSLDSAILDIGNCIFSCGQAYVAISRVKNLSGVHLINFDPSQIKAQQAAIVEYNRLRLLYRPDLHKLALKQKRIKKVADRDWALRPIISMVQIPDRSLHKKNPPHRKRKSKSNHKRKKRKF